MKIFIEIPTWLGDAVMVTPAIENIVTTYPKAKLTIFGSFVSTKLFLHHPNVDKIIIDDSKKEGNRYKNLFKLAKSVGSVDLALSFRKNFTTKYLLFFIKSKQKFRYKRLDKELKTHQVIRYNDIINYRLGLSTKPNRHKIYQENFETKNEKPILGLNPGATYGSAKRWYPSEFAKVAIVL
ncbi:MAG: ADP-heptose--LPS heptosyltransferase, partial [Arcobacteraceae bacterium]